jgi:hypothetical protein
MLVTCTNYYNQPVTNPTFKQQSEASTFEIGAECSDTAHLFKPLRSHAKCKQRSNALAVTRLSYQPVISAIRKAAANSDLARVGLLSSVKNACTGTRFSETTVVAIGNLNRNYDAN